MKSKKIYLVRHGQTDFNLRGIVQGSGIDSSLNAKGRSQASQFFDAYKDIPFDKVYTSKLKRTLESVQGFLNLGIPHESLSWQNENKCGNREGLVITPEEHAYYYEVIAAWKNGETNLRIEGGESPQDVFDRQTAAIQHILNHDKEENVLVCMHGRAMRVLLCQILNYPLRCMDEFEHSNLCLYLLSYTGSMFTVERFNDTAHLTSTEVGG